MSLSCLAPPYGPRTASYQANVELRLLEPGDSTAVLEVFAGLSDRSRELRFLTPKPRLTSADLQQLTDVDQHDHVAVLALTHSRPIGVARFVRHPEDADSADVAVAVVDEWQDRGIGTRLTRELVRRARGLGVRRFTMAMAPDNEGAVRLLHRAPGEIERLAIDPDVAEFALSLVDHPPTRRRRRFRSGARR
jgi:ribosomal protein S18 acetylase RimI-like enzyme